MSALSEFSLRLAPLARLARTIRRLTLRQVVSRIGMGARFRAYRRMPALAAVQIRGEFRLRNDGLAALRGWSDQRYPGGPSAARVALGERIRAGRFPFVGREVPLAGPPLDWRPPGESALWLYHLHYFDYLIALSLAERAGMDRAGARGWDLVDDWLSANAPGSAPGWEPYPTSIRLVNWAAAWALDPHSVETSARGEELLATAIAAQARFVERHLEYHIGGNHLIKNARALIVAGRLFDGPEGGRWSRSGRALLRKELRAQVLADGGHYERSPMYHAVVLEDLLDCIVLDPTLADLQDVARGMTSWLKTMSHPDGGLALFNDTVAYPDPPAAEVLGYSARIVGPTPEHDRDHRALDASGYFLLADGSGRMIVDCGEIGPNELAAHAHADTLSFELTWNGMRAIVDSGVSEYSPGMARSYVRSTLAHNTVVVDGIDQSEVWLSHRAGRRAQPIGPGLERSAHGVRFVGGHDGYSRLGIVHARHIVTLRGVWIIIDEMLGSGRHRFESLVHLHPDLAAAKANSSVLVRSSAGVLWELRSLGAESTSIGRGWYHPSWGTTLANDVIRLGVDRRAPTAFGYALVQLGMDAAVAFSQGPRGIAIDATIDGFAMHVASDRPAGMVP